MNDSTAGTNRPAWELESTHPELVDGLRDALAEVIDPELGLNIIQLGLIRDVKMQDNNVIVRMILTTPFCPYGPAMLEETRRKAETHMGIPAHIDLGMEMWDFSMMEEGLGGDWGLY